MKIVRFLAFGFFLLMVSMGHAMPPMSARKIAPIEIGSVGSNDMKISRDGRFLSLLSIPGEKGSDCIVFDRRTHKTTQLVGSSRMEPLCFSRDGRRLWVWGLHLDERLPGLSLKPGDYEFIALYDLRRKRYVRALTDVRDDEVPSDGVLARDGRTLVYATSDGWVCGFNTRTGRVMWRRRAQDKGDEPVSIKLSPDGSKFLRTSDDEDGQAQSAEVVSTRSLSVLARFHLPFAQSGGMRSAFSGGRFAPRGEQVALFQPDTQQWVFLDPRTAKVQWKVGGPSRTSEGDLKWQWSPDARFVGVSGPKGFELCDAQTGRVLQRCAALKGSSLAFSPDSSLVYALADNESGFGAFTTLWQWRLFPTVRQRRADARFMRRLHSREERFALSPRHINESLIQAARGGDAGRVAFLIDRGANIETCDGRGDSALANAVWSNDVYKGPHAYYATAKLLIARGANVSKHGGALLAGAESDALTELLLAHGAHPNTHLKNG